MCLIVAVMIPGCSATPVNPDPEQLTSRRKTSWDHFGTLCSVVVFDDFTSAANNVRFESVWQDIYTMFTELERTISVGVPGSDIYRFNNARSGESVSISSLTAEIVREAMKMYFLSDGAYNPAVMPLVDLWGFSPRFSLSASGGEAMPYDRVRNRDGSFDLPDQRYVDAFVSLSDLSEVLLEGSSTEGYYLHKATADVEVDGRTYSLQIDLGGIGKGYAAEVGAEMLRQAGYEYGFVSVGMSSMQMLKRNVADTGAPDVEMWAVHVANPDDPQERFLTGFGKDTGVSTSGTYFARYYVEGREYSHIIDLSTGEPTTSDVVAVTIIGGNAGYIDALTTALCVMGSEKAVQFMDDHLQDYQVVLIVRRGDTLVLVTNMPDKNYILY